ncbi:DNA polymerase beta domain protein region [Gloeothece citriformis PCC 7424]|uniref:DNA polymerase beta domain protein region n=1 Tax=Gloeothece citriformis (strain PCC 7424) TaxID=65393 RepID=B7KIZ2_GLOC7|nr:nucleotidyltransferase domain-containing protein [Gloeothece citriformis]ACK70828.1 DNA polymerase beta domain protein region [Gloeothece citriformis PCC 7424]
MSALDDRTRSQIVAQVLKARANRGDFLEQMQQRQQKGWEIARQCAKILKEQFGVRRVVLFGSMLNLEEMSYDSDIDLAVWGLPEKDLFRAGAALERGHDFVVDLVEVQKAKPHILKAIEKGMEL